MRDQNRDEGFYGARDGGEPVDKPQPLDSRYFISRDELARIFVDAPHIDYQSFREDIDAYVDPTPREWPFPTGPG